jgi:hypothetical protein
MSSSTSAAAGGGDLIHDEGVNHALQFHFDHTQDVEQLLEVARKLLASKNFEAVHAFAAQAHEKLQILENARRTRDLRMKDLTEALTTKAFDKKLTLERDLYQMLPAYVKRTEQAHQQLVLSISQVALSAALTKRSDAKALQVVDRKVGIIDLETLDDEVLTVRHHICRVFFYFFLFFSIFFFQHSGYYYCYFCYYYFADQAPGQKETN